MSEYMFFNGELLRKFYDPITNSYAVPMYVLSDELSSALRTENVEFKNALEAYEKRLSSLEDELARRDAVIEALKAKNERLKSAVQLFGTY